MPAMDPTLLLDTLLRGAGIALALLLAATVARLPTGRGSSRLAVALALGLALQIVGGHPVLESGLARWLVAVLVGVAVANAVLFVALAWALFRDGPPRWTALLPAWTAAWALGAANVALGCARRDEPWAVLAIGAQRLLPLLCGVAALALAARDWRGDLIEPRRRLRLLVVAGGGVYTLAQLALRLGQPGGRLTGLPALADSVLVLLMLAAIAALWLQPTRALDDWSAPATPPPAPPTATTEAPAPDPDDALVAQRLRRALTEEQVWRQGDLSLGALAQRLNCPEYRLRRVIRDHLGHGHFNAFINAHRVADACQALADPARRAEAVLSVALAAGFQSIGPFNRAFKAETGLTPTEYRRRRLADS